MLKISRAALALVFIVAGVAHFVSPGAYVAIMPTSLPWPVALVYISGVAEIAGGAGVLFARTRRTAALGLMILLVAVFPANIHAAQSGMILFGWSVPPWILWLRLPLQAVLIAWVYFVGWKDREVPR